VAAVGFAVRVTANQHSVAVVIARWLIRGPLCAADTLPRSPLARLGLEVVGPIAALAVAGPSRSGCHVTDLGYTAGKAMVQSIRWQ